MSLLLIFFRPGSVYIHYRMARISPISVALSTDEDMVRLMGRRCGEQRGGGGCYGSSTGEVGSLSHFDPFTNFRTL